MTEALARALARVAPGWPAALCREVAANAQRVHIPDGRRVFRPGDRSQGFIIPLSGAVRVEHIGPTGRVVVLYRVGPGDSCVMTTSCLVSGASYRAWGFAEGDVEALALSPESFRTLIDQNAAFRAMVLGVFAQRLLELVEVIDELLLHRVDLRLAAWLAERGTAAPVAATHQAIAAELGTAREVVSRILKDFERRGWIRLGRGEIAVDDAGALAAFAAQR